MTEGYILLFIGAGVIFNLNMWGLLQACKAKPVRNRREDDEVVDLVCRNGVWGCEG